MNAHERVEALYPLSPSQLGMWLQSQGDPGSSLFVEQAAFSLDGAPDFSALRRALQDVVDRHGALRSAILSKGREPARAVLRQLPVTLTEVQAPQAEEESALAALMDRERSRGFALNRPPLIRFAVLALDDGRAWLIVSFHHIILDGWSLAVLWAEAEERYAAIVAGTASALPPAPDEAEFASWLSARSEAESERFWRARLAGFTSPNRLANLPLQASLAEPESWECRLTREAGEALATAARAARVSPATVVEVLWALIVAGRTRASDVAFAATVSGRPAELPGVERMVGCFINTVPIRIRFDDASSLRACLIDHQERRAAQHEHEYCSAGQIHGWSEVPASRPLSQSLLVYENVPATARAAPVAVQGARVRGARTAYPLTLVISPGLEPHLRIVYQPAGWTSAEARAFANDLERLILACPEALDRPIASLRASLAAAVLPPDAPAAISAEAPFVAPRTLLEFQLATIWADLFGRPQVGVLDDFFGLGGHSLLALQMVAQVRATLGIEVPLHVLIGSPTIERLAEACAAQRGPDQHFLVPIAAGGAGMPVFCIHPLGGHVLCYAALGRALRSRHPVWGLQARGLRPGESPAASWEEVLEHHWALLLEAQGRSGAGARVDGVALVGYSYGGYIAMELAARAYRNGATRVPLFLLDVPHPSTIPDEARHPDVATFVHALFGAPLGLELSALRAMPEERVLDFVHGAAVAARMLPPDTSLDQLQRALAVAQAHSRLEPAPARYPFPAVLLRAREGAARISERPDLGWSEMTAELTIEWVDGRHETMLEPPFADGTAARIIAGLTASGEPGASSSPVLGAAGR